MSALKPWNLQKARAMRNSGCQWGEIAAYFGISKTAAFDRCKKGIDLVKNATPRRRVIPCERFNPILLPQDDRSLTAVFCGDPLPGRSALDRRHGAR
jgi:hypothetical protein